MSVARPWWRCHVDDTELSVTRGFEAYTKLNITLYRSMKNTVPRVGGHPLNVSLSPRRFEAPEESQSGRFGRRLHGVCLLWRRHIHVVSRLAA